MQPTMCSRCHKNVAVIFITKLEGGETKNEGLCLKCARELGIKPIDDMMKKMGISDEDLDNLTNEMMSAFGGAEGAGGLVAQGGGGEEGGGAGPPSDDADGRRQSRGEAQHQSQQEGGEDAQLGGCAQQQGHGIGQQRAEVRHRPDPHKDDGRVNGVLDALIDDPHKANAACMGSRVHHRRIE